MNVVDFIRTKAESRSHPPGAIARFVSELVRDTVPDYQVSAWLMAVRLNGLDPDETVELTRAMAASGRQLNWKMRGAPPTVDKHSTGGEGDKITLLLVPMLVACGLRVPTIAGRALGFTGGTIDKMEAIPGFRTALELRSFQSVIRYAGGAIVGQSASIAPADRILYALRDATATVESTPLITASIVSKKVAEGVAHIVYDVKAGSGAFMRDVTSAAHLARSLVSVSRDLGLDARALVTDMHEPLGLTAGNAVEVAEAVEILRGDVSPRSARVVELALQLGSELLRMAKVEKNDGSARHRLFAALSSGAAFEAFARMVRAQGGQTKWMNRPWSIVPRHRTFVLPASRDGWVEWRETWRFGEALRLLGAGRAQRSDKIVPAAGAIVHAGSGQKVSRGDIILELHYAHRSRLDDALQSLKGAVAVASSPVRAKPLVMKRIG